MDQLYRNHHQIHCQIISGEKSKRGGIRMYLYELYRDLYYKEMQERQYYDGRMSFTLTLLSVTAGAISYFISKVESVSLLIKIFIGISILLFIVELILTFNAYFSWTYKYYDFPVNKIEGCIRKHYDKESYKKINKMKLSSEDWLYGKLSRMYAICCRKYYEENLKKRRTHHLLNIFSYINLCLLLFMFILIQL